MKNWKYIKVLCLLFVMLIGFQSSVDAQVRSRKSKDKTTSKKSKKEIVSTVSLMDQLNPEIKFGNIGFFNGFSLSTKLNIGYKITERLSAGIGGKLFFNQFLGQGSGADASFLDLGAMIYARGKITNDIYLQAEYSRMRFDLGNNVKVNSTSPLIGAGYMSGVGKWRFGVELLYIVDGPTRQLQNSIVEYWFGASYNF